MSPSPRRESSRSVKKKKPASRKKSGTRKKSGSRQAGAAKRSGKKTVSRKAVSSKTVSSKAVSRSTARRGTPSGKARGESPGDRNGRDRSGRDRNGRDRNGPGNRDKIRRHILECQVQGESPTVREIGEAVGLRSPATVLQHLRVMEREGIIEQTGAGRSRCWRVIQAPRGRNQRIPIAGRIAAGAPIESPEEELEFLTASPRTFAASGEVVALLVEGDSMIDAGILPGDHAIIRRQPTVENGEIAAVTINGEGTLKRWRVKNERISLEPANRLFSPIVLGRRSGDVRVYGKLVGVVRNY